MRETGSIWETYERAERFLAIKRGLHIALLIWYNAELHKLPFNNLLESVAEDLKRSRRILYYYHGIFTEHALKKGLLPPPRGVAEEYTTYTTSIDELADDLYAQYGSLRKMIGRTENKENNNKEDTFYKPFSEFLVRDLKECTKAIPLGGNKFSDKWGTPDVIGIYKLSDIESFKPSPEIISAEIKSDTNQLITAFGQACSYKLFSHKVYLVIPKEAERDKERVESLCRRFGIGLVLFDSSNPDNPNFEIRARAEKGEPDFTYINTYMRRLGEVAKELF